MRLGRILQYPGKAGIRGNAIVLLFLTHLVFVLHYSILDNQFLSDDYDSLYRIIIEKTILINGFFRPIIDLSFLVDYKIFGLNASGFYFVNLLIHIANCFLVFLFAKKFIVLKNQDQVHFSLLAAFLFCVYPFHNESVTWLTGRISAIACLFALGALNILFSELPVVKKRFLMALLYLTGLLAYESIFLLPVIFIIFELNTNPGRKALFTSALFWLAIALLYLVLRVVFSGTVYGDYGQRMVEVGGILVHVSTFLKVFGRTLLPPMDNSRLLMILFSVVMSSVLILLIAKRKALDFKNSLYSRPTQLFIGFLVALVLPLLFGISTRTSEGERMLYFPSVFLCMLISYLVLKMVSRPLARGIIISGIGIYFIYFLKENNQLWEKASGAASTIMRSANQNKSAALFINMPEEIEGAYVFRNGFKKALVIEGLDTNRIKSVNLLTRDEAMLHKNNIQPLMRGDTLFIYPESRIYKQSAKEYLMTNSKNDNFAIVDTNAVFYWNKIELKKVF